MFLARFWREAFARLATEGKRRETRGKNVNATLKLNWVITVVAIALAAVAAGSPLFA